MQSSELPQKRIDEMNIILYLLIYLYILNEIIAKNEYLHPASSLCYSELADDFLNQHDVAFV